MTVAAVSYRGQLRRMLESVENKKVKTQQIIEAYILLVESTVSAGLVSGFMLDQHRPKQKSQTRGRRYAYRSDVREIS